MLSLQLSPCFTVTLLVLFVCIHGMEYNINTCPRKYHGIDKHTACLIASDDFVSGGISSDDKELILRVHNKHRAAVSPPACDMMKMYWDNDLAFVAQKLTSSCVYEHDDGFKRSIPGKYSVGQNIGLGYNSWKHIIDDWYKEVKDFTYNGANTKGVITHYTQVVWASSAAIGCGFAICNGGRRLYACNYGPGGNYAGAIKTPYKKCDKKTSLIDCKGKICYNGGSRVGDTCNCRCKKQLAFIYEPECRLNCSLGNDPGHCTSSYKPSHCTAYANVPDECPHMCKICPYVGDGSDPETSPDGASTFTGQIYMVFTVISMSLMTLLTL